MGLLTLPLSLPPPSSLPLPIQISLYNMIQRRLVAMTVLVAVYRPYPAKESEAARRGRVKKGQKGAARRKRRQRRRRRQGDKEDDEGRKKGRKGKKGHVSLERTRTRTRKACVVKNSRPKQKAERGETSEHRSALCFMPERVLNKRVMCLSVATTTTTTTASTINGSTNPPLPSAITTTTVSTTSAAAATAVAAVPLPPSPSPSPSPPSGPPLYGRYTQPTHTYTPTPW